MRPAGRPSMRSDANRSCASCTPSLHRQWSSTPKPSLLAPPVTDKLRKMAARLLARSADQLGAEYPGLRIETAQQEGGPVPVLVLVEQSGRTIATVVGPDGEGRLEGAFFGGIRSTRRARPWLHCDRPPQADGQRDFVTPSPVLGAVVHR